MCNFIVQRQHCSPRARPRRAEEQRILTTFLLRFALLKICYYLMEEFIIEEYSSCCVDKCPSGTEGILVGFFCARGLGKLYSVICCSGSNTKSIFAVLGNLFSISREDNFNRLPRMDSWHYVRDVAHVRGAGCDIFLFLARRQFHAFLLDALSVAFCQCIVRENI